MEKIDITASSTELKEIVSKYETTSFVGFFAAYIRLSKNSDGPPIVFTSNLKDVLYLIGLKLSCDESGKKPFYYDEKQLRTFASKIDRIKLAYSKNIVESASRENAFWTKGILSENAFSDYFHNGKLTYIQQDISRFEKVFKPFEEEIIRKLGFGPTFMVHFFYLLQELMVENERHISKINNSDEIQEVIRKHIDKADDLEEYLKSLPEHIYDYFVNAQSIPYSALVFSLQEFEGVVDIAQAELFIEKLTCIPKPNDYLYYTDNNIVDRKPILKIGEDLYLNIFQKQLPIAFFNLCQEVIQKELNLTSKLSKRRAHVLEEQVIQEFKNFLGDKVYNEFFQSYYIDKHYEQDILVKSKKAVLVIEAKARNIRMPFRNYDQLVNHTKADFKSSIQSGYEQCKRVEDKFRSNTEFNITSKTHKLLRSFKIDEVKSVFSIIVTDQRIGANQVSLGTLLEKEKYDPYPLSICIDDLIILLQAFKIKFKNSSRSKLMEYLTIRQTMHDKRIYVADELDIASYFINHLDDLKENLNSDAFMISGDFQNYFDDLYFGGQLFNYPDKDPILL